MKVRSFLLVIICASLMFATSSSATIITFDGYSDGTDVNGEIIESALTITTGPNGYAYIAASATYLGTTTPNSYMIVAVPENSSTWLQIDFVLPINYVSFYLIGNTSAYVQAIYTGDTSPSLPILGRMPVTTPTGRNHFERTFAADVDSIYIRRMDSRSADWDGKAGIESIEFRPSDASPVPEPATMILFGIGLLGLTGVSRTVKQ